MRMQWFIFSILFASSLIVDGQDTYREYIGVYHQDSLYFDIGTSSDIVKIFSSGFYTISSVTGMPGSGTVDYEFGYSFSRENKVIFMPISRRTSDRNIGIFTYFLDYRSINGETKEYIMRNDSLIDCFTRSQFNMLMASPPSILGIIPGSGHHTGTYYSNKVEFFDKNRATNRDNRINKKFKNRDIFDSYEYSNFRIQRMDLKLDSVYRKAGNVIRTAIERDYNSYLSENHGILTSEIDGTLIGVFDRSKDRLIIYQNNLLTEISRLEAILRSSVIKSDSKIFIVEIKRNGNFKIEIRK